MLHVAADTDAPFDCLSGVLSHASGKRRVLFLDYDGTLVPFADEPHLAHPDAELLDLLQRLCARGDTAIHVVTGRARTSIGGWLGHLDLGLHAEHGCWSRSNPRSEWTLRSRETTEWMRDVRAVMTELVRGVPRSFVEEKERGLAWHYRLSEPTEALPACARLRAELAPLLVRHRLEVLAGASVLEIRSRGVDKGLVVADILRGEGDEVFVAAFGDDVTDDDMFAALPARGFAIGVSHRPQRAHRRVPDHHSIRAFLERLCAADEGARDERAP